MLETRRMQIQPTSLPARQGKDRMTCNKSPKLMLGYWILHFSPFPSILHAIDYSSRQREDEAPRKRPGLAFFSMVTSDILGHASYCSCLAWCNCCANYICSPVSPPPSLRNLQDPAAWTLYLYHVSKLCWEPGRYRINTAVYLVYWFTAKSLPK